ncbi:hypothetical protein CDL15_Pgr006028 [Punica granatum]|uniref:Uncharacterized protein n=1 Tax=Punica granatum TaxID=22663 RepID=A0A218VTQ6_PUNGR|nr:hypothetical protein CDL15_Pgr006028 [Punica granatum]
MEEAARETDEHGDVEGDEDDDDHDSGKDSENSTYNPRLEQYYTWDEDYDQFVQSTDPHLEDHEMHNACAGVVYGYFSLHEGSFPLSEVQHEEKL